MDEKVIDFSGYPHLEKYVKKNDKFVLDKDRNVIPATLFEWGEFMDKKKERIVRQDTVNNLWISTVFIGLDHNWRPIMDEFYKPHIFETMIFKDNEDIYCDRYSTWAEAEEGHKKAIQWIADGCKEDKDDE